MIITTNLTLMQTFTSNVIWMLHNYPARMQVLRVAPVVRRMTLGGLLGYCEGK